MSHYLVILLIFLVLLLISKILRDIFTFYWRERSAIRSLFQGISIAVISTCLFLLISEALLHQFLVRTDFFGFTYSAQRWWDVYWTPVNEFGYRDGEINLPGDSTKDLAIVLGDSIVAGHGIDKIDDRFSNLLEDKLGSRWRVLNVAKCGWSTSDEIAAIHKHLAEVKPKFVVLSYFFNDIEGVLKTKKIAFPILVSRPDGVFGDLIENSAILNFIYWKTYKLFHPDLGSTYWNFIKKQSEDPENWESHSKELHDLAQELRSNGVKLVVVIFPTLLSPENDRFNTDRVKALFLKAEVPVIDLHDDLASISPLDRVVSESDPHPSLRMNRLVTEKIAAVLCKNAWVSDPTCSGSQSIK